MRRLAPRGKRWRETWREGWSKWGNRRAKRGKRDEKKRREGEGKRKRDQKKWGGIFVVDGGLFPPLPPLGLDDPHENALT